MNKRGLIRANSASFCDKSGRLLPALVNEPLVLFPSSQLHNPDFSSKILEFASCLEGAESSLDSAESQNLSENQAQFAESSLDSAISNIKYYTL